MQRVLFAVASLAAWTCGGATAQDPMCAKARLRELVRSMHQTHGGPAYVSSAALERARKVAEDMLDEDAEYAEQNYMDACSWLLNQLLDPLASHLPPLQAVAARERFHGRASLGITLRMCLVR